MKSFGSERHNIRFISTLVLKIWNSMSGQVSSCLVLGLFKYDLAGKCFRIGYCNDSTKTPKEFFVDQ